MMRLCWQIVAAAVFLAAAPSIAEPFNGSARYAEDVANELKPQEPDTDLLALMSGKCSTLKVAGRDFACTTVAYAHSTRGRAYFTIALDDPADHNHIISFSGEDGRRTEDNLYELTVDRMLLNSKNRPKVDGLPVPSAELATGLCRQFGNVSTKQISSISCSATDKNGKKYELQFDSDGSPIKVRRLRQSPLVSEKRRARQTEQRECRQKADVAKVLPRDWPAYINRCLAEVIEKPAPDAPQ
jgi:hypothetical protein